MAAAGPLHSPCQGPSAQQMYPLTVPGLPTRPGPCREGATDRPTGALTSLCLGARDQRRCVGNRPPAADKVKPQEVTLCHPLCKTRVIVLTSQSFSGLNFHICETE